MHVTEMMYYVVLCLGAGVAAVAAGVQSYAVAHAARHARRAHA